MRADIGWILGVLFVFAAMWIVGGGVTREETTRGPFIHPLPPVGTGEVYGPDIIKTPRKGARRETDGAEARPTDGKYLYYYEAGRNQEKPGGVREEIRRAETSITTSPLKGKLDLARVNAFSQSPQEEYVEITASYNIEPVLLTDLVLKSEATGRSVTIGKGVRLIRQGTINTEEPIYLPPGGVAYVITGRSPVGYSLRLNRCTGFFEQFQDFTPALPIECPLPSDEPLPPPPNNFDDTCLDFLEDIGSCRIVPNPSVRISLSCQDHVRSNVNYPRCVELHKNEPDFYKNNWRIYLMRDERLWKNRREVIKLLDQNGKEIDAITY